ncbi:MAG: CinA family protein, partial [Bacteroidetes bacterium]|nr:CinA family protein [Bacteroidota bacterium]
GSSAYYKGSIVSYANEVKTALLHVSPQTLATEGAVSEATVQQMITGVLGAIDTDYAIAVSGIMGPGGGSPEKPVGMVWIAVGNRKQTITRQFNYRFDRRRNIDLTATNALNMLRTFILEQEPKP